MTEQKLKSFQIEAITQPSRKVQIHQSTFLSCSQPKKNKKIPRKTQTCKPSVLGVLLRLKFGNDSF